MYKQTELNRFQNQLLDLMDRLDRDRRMMKQEALQPVGGAASGGISNVPLHQADLGSHEADEATEMVLVQNKEHLMREIDEALDRIEEGHFGSCESCQQGIGRERLKVLPYTRYCVRCAAEMEEGG